MSMVSLQLAIFNLLPIRSDGGVILMLLVEMMMQGSESAVKEKVFRWALFIMVIVAFVIYRIPRFFRRLKPRNFRALSSTD